MPIAACLLFASCPRPVGRSASCCFSLWVFKVFVQAKQFMFVALNVKQLYFHFDVFTTKYFEIFRFWCFSVTNKVIHCIDTRTTNAMPYIYSILVCWINAYINRFVTQILDSEITITSDKLPFERIFYLFLFDFLCLISAVVIRSGDALCDKCLVYHLWKYLQLFVASYNSRF